jgi:hypothetical protein
MQEVAARGGKLILMTDAKGASASEGQSLAILTLPTMAAEVTPLVYAVPVQLLAYHTAVVMGTDVDQPRNLCQVGDSTRSPLPPHLGAPSAQTRPRGVAGWRKRPNATLALLSSGSET